MHHRAAPRTRDGRLVAALLRNLVVYNPLFLFSAMLVLGGAWLLNPPEGGGGRDLGLLTQLYGAIQAYELCLLGAAWTLARRGGLGRDVRNLAVVLAPFLVDGTFTTAALTSSVDRAAGWPAAAGFVALAFAATAAKAALAARLVGRRFSAREWTLLLAGPALALTYPLAARTLAGPAGDAATLLGGTALGVLALAFAGAADRAGSGPALRRLSVVPLVVGALHLGGATWAQSGSLLLVAAPFLVALGPALPRLAWPGRAAGDQLTPLVLPALGAVCAGLADGHLHGASAWSLALGGAVTVHAVSFARFRSLRFLGAVLLGLHLAWGGATLDASLAAVGHNPVEPLGLLLLFGYGLLRAAPPVALAPPLLLAAALTYRLHPLGNALDAALALDLVGAGLLAWTHRTHGVSRAGARFRLAGAVAIYLPACLLAVHPHGPAPAAAEWLALGSLAGLLVLYAATRARTYAIPALLVPGAAALRLAPSSAAGWGVVGLGLAFATVSLGVLVSLRRERLLAWIDHPGPAPPDTGGEPPAAEADAPAAPSPAAGSAAG